MNDRDELADILMSDTLREAAYYGRSYALAEADAILTAGYRKPRQITTVEELDSLPGESVVRDASGIPYELDYTIGNPSDKWWVATGMTEHLEHRHLELPATVLYEPLPDCCTADGPTCATCASYAAEDAEPQP